MSNYIRKRGLSSILAMIALGFVGVAGGCRTDAQTGALLGSGLGAGLGAIIGNNMHGHTAEGALIGAGIGALGGYAVGNESDKQHAWQHRGCNYDY